MKTLSDYKDDEAIELWADLIEPLSKIFSNEEFTRSLQGKNKLTIAKEVLQNYKSEAVEILLRIDPTPLDGMNIVLRLVALLADIGRNEEIKVFFGSVGKEITGRESSGSVTENIEDGEQ